MLKSFICFLSFILLCLLISGCEVDAVGKEQVPFFDVKAFIAKEINANEAIKVYQKSIDLDGQEEKKELSQLDLANELAIFTDADINKVAWLDKYEVDSLFDQNGRLHHVHYKAKEERLNTRSLSVAFDSSGSVDSLFIHNASTSMVADSEEWLTYIPKTGYRIENRQKVTAQPEHALIVDVKFVY